MEAKVWMPTLGAASEGRTDVGTAPPGRSCQNWTRLGQRIPRCGAGYRMIAGCCSRTLVQIVVMRKQEEHRYVILETMLNPALIPKGRESAYFETKKSKCEPRTWSLVAPQWLTFFTTEPLTWTFNGHRTKENPKSIHLFGQPVGCRRAEKSLL